MGLLGLRVSRVLGFRGFKVLGFRVPKAQAYQVPSGGNDGNCIRLDPSQDLVSRAWTKIRENKQDNKTCRVKWDSELHSGSWSGQCLPNRTSSLHHIKHPGIIEEILPSNGYSAPWVAHKQSQLRKGLGELELRFLIQTLWNSMVGLGFRV